MLRSTEAKPQRAADPRPARTRAAILDAIERLGAKEGVELTVATIVAEAQLSRSSFYSQFKDLADVAVQLIRDLYDEIEMREMEEGDTITARAAARTRVRLLIEELADRRHLYAAVFGTAVSAEAQRQICSIIAQGTLSAVRRLAPRGVTPEQATIYIAAGSLSVLVEWLMDGTRDSIDEIEAELEALLPAWASTP